MYISINFCVILYKVYIMYQVLLIYYNFMGFDNAGMGKYLDILIYTRMFFEVRYFYLHKIIKTRTKSNNTSMFIS